MALFPDLHELTAIPTTNRRDATAFDELLLKWDGERAEIAYDLDSEAWLLVCLHSTRLGPAAGGTRMRVYPTPADGLADAMRLSAAMTRKLAVAGLPFGGGKAVLAVPAIPHGVERRRLLLRYAELFESLEGRFWTGPDLNTDERDMDLLPNAIVRSEATGGPGSSAPATATGVLHGIRASAQHAFGSDRLDGLVALVQGVGGVGSRLAELLVEAGAHVSVSDVDAKRVRDLASQLSVRAVAPERVLGADCDVFAPCAVGEILSEDTIPRLRCRVVAGAANNQLVTAKDGDRLRQAGVLYAPDYVINAGGALHGIGLAALDWTRDELDRQLAAIGERLTAIYRESDRQRISTAAAADQLAAARLERPIDGDKPIRDRR